MMPGSEIIGRDKEKRILEDVWKSREAEFLAIYGRRRIGKTFLIRNFFQIKASSWKRQELKISL